MKHIITVLVISFIFSQAAFADDITDFVDNTVKTVTEAADELIDEAGAAVEEAEEAAKEKTAGEILGLEETEVEKLDVEKKLWRNPRLKTAVSISQAYFSNWAAGGESSFAWQVNLDAGIDREDDGTRWVNDIYTKYGMASIGTGRMRKTVDEIRIESLFAFKIYGVIEPFISVKGYTQMTPGYEYADDGTATEVSKFMDPGYFRQSFGIKFQPADWYKSRLGGALKQTLTDLFTARYAGDSPDKFKNELGTDWINEFNFKVGEVMNIVSKVDIFFNFKALDETDVDWDTSVVFAITDYLNTTISFTLVYDADVIKKAQIKESLSLGVAYNFF